MPDLRDAKHAIWDFSDNILYIYRDAKHVIRDFRDNIVYIYLLIYVWTFVYLLISFTLFTLLSDRFQK